MRELPSVNTPPLCGFGVIHIALSRLRKPCTLVAQKNGKHEQAPKEQPKQAHCANQIYCTPGPRESQLKWARPRRRPGSRGAVPGGVSSKNGPHAKQHKNPVLYYVDKKSLPVHLFVCPTKQTSILQPLDISSRNQNFHIFARFGVCLGREVSPGRRVGVPRAEGVVTHRLSTARKQTQPFRKKKEGILRRAATRTRAQPRTGSGPRPRRPSNSRPTHAHRPPTLAPRWHVKGQGCGAGRCGERCEGRGAGLGRRGPGGARPPRHATTAAVFVQLALRWGRNWAA